MLRKFLASTLMLMVTSFFARAGYQPIAVTGFNADVIANGSSFVAGSTVTADVDGGGYYFLNQSFTAFGTPTYYLPNSGLLNSAATSGLSFQLADASSFNSLRLLNGNQTGTLAFVSPTNAGTVYVLVTGGNTSSSLNITVTFTDATTQVFNSQTVNDWYNGSGFVAQGIGRMTATGLDNGGGSSNPRLYQIALSINSTNYNKQIQSISFERTTTTTSIAHIMGVSILTPCATPTAQATSLVLTPSGSGQVNGSFSAASPAADQYLVVRYPAGSTTTNPVDATTYTTGSSIGLGTVVQYGATTTFSSPSLSANTQYDYYIYSANTATCVGGPVYLTSSTLFGTVSTPACSGPGNTTIAVGASQTYTTLGAAVNSLSSGITGAITIELQSDYVSTGETYPITFPYNACITATNSIVVRPAIGATGLQIAGSAANPMIDISGGTYITIDGRPGGTGSSPDLKIINTNTGGAAIRLVNDASNNTIKYCDLQGQNTSVTSSALSGVVYIGTSTGSNGNDNNSISNNNIHGPTGAYPAMGLVGYGTTTTVSTYNDNNTITNNNIYDYFIAGNTSTGMKVDVGNNAWTITGNSIYQTATRTFTSAVTQRGFWITPNTASVSNTASAFIINNNYVGGMAATAGGAALTMSGSVGYTFMGMDLSLGLGTASSVQGNVIQNISMTSSSTSTSGVFIGIGTANGNINIGTVSGNAIGSASTTGSIAVTTTSGGGTTFGIRVGGGNSIAVANNTVAGVTVSGSTTSIYTNFIGIGTGVSNGGATTVTISGNTVGSTTVANSINMPTVYTSTSGQQLLGINISNGVTTSTISNNIVGNLSNSVTGTSTSSSVRGIVVSTSASSITGNTVRNLTCATAETSGGASSAIAGIIMSSTNTAGCNVTGNTIHSLVSTSASTSATINITGLFYNGTSSAVSSISRNFIHSFDVTGANTSAVITAIDFSSATATISNNMIRMGIKPDGTSITTACTVRGLSSNSSTATQNLWHNTIYIGGTGVGSTVKPSYAFIRTASSGTYDIKNNIFVNVRSNAGTGGSHYALYFTTAATGAAINYNLYQANGTGGIFATTNSGSTNVAAYTSGWISGDVNSVSGDPLFIAPLGTASTVDLHASTTAASPQYDAGTYLAAVTIDFDGDARSAVAPDMGADEFNYCVAGKWIGGISSDWNNAANWCDAVPTATTTVLIPSSAANMPVISGTANALNITLKPSTSITVTSGSLNITDLIVAGSSTLAGSGKLNITGTVSFSTSNATLAAGGTLVLASTASGTARVADITNAGTNSGNSITGNVIMQRYIPGGSRKFRFVGHPFTSMNLTELTDDIDITGTITGSNANNFTATGSSATSAFTFTEANGNGAANDAGWTALTSGSSITGILQGQGMRILVRGTKGQAGSLTGGSYTPAAVTLGMAGTLTQGNYAQSLSNTSAPQGWNLISNPYPSKVDWTLVTKTNVDNAVYTYRPGLGGGNYGSYVNGSVANGGSQYIESSSAFFVHTNASSPSLGWTEATKVTNAPTNSTFRNLNNIHNRISLTLINTATNNTDEVVLRFGDDRATDLFDKEYDAANLAGTNHDLYVLDRASTKYSIYHGSELENSLTEKREINLGIGNLVAGDYSFTAKTLNAFVGNNIAYLRDAEQHTLTAIGDSTVYSFTVAGSTGPLENRFSVVFNAKEQLALPSLNTTFTVNVYPNPANSTLNVQYTGLNEAAATSLLIVSAEGKIVSSMDLGKVGTGRQSIAIRQIPSGNYTVVLMNGDNKQTTKITKQ